MINGVGYVRTVEKMLGVEIPERGVLVRTILSEFSRIMDHCVNIGANLVDIGALTNFWYLYQPREKIYGLLEACCGARLTVSYVRVGGLAIDVPEDFVARCRALLESIPKFLDDVDRLVTNNRIARNRLQGTGVVTKEQAIAWGLTGPMLRASGVPYDVRRARPYDFYDRFDWDVAIATDGDNFARYLVRMEEMRQSLKIIRQALDIFPEKGPVNSDDWHVVLPPKDAVYHDMESLIYHFKLIMEGIRVPTGRALRVDRGRQRRARLLRRLRGRRRALPAEGPPPVLPEHGGLREDRRRRHDLRRGRDARDPEHHRRGARPMSGVVDVSVRTPEKLTLAQRLYLPEILGGHAGHDRAPPAQPRRDAEAPDDPLPRREARLLRPLPGQAHPEDARGRDAEVRRLLHVPAGLPGRVHHDRGGRAPEDRLREVPGRLRHRHAALRLLRLLRGRLPQGRDLDDARLRDGVLHSEEAIFGIDKLVEKPGVPVKDGYGYRPYYPGDGTVPPTDSSAAPVTPGDGERAKLREAGLLPVYRPSAPQVASKT